MNIIYDVTSAVVNREEAILALFDNRYASIMIVRPAKDKEGNLELGVTEPDGAERLYWLEKFGIITEEDFQVEVEKLAPITERRKLYDMLKKELE